MMRLFAIVLVVAGMLGSHAASAAVSDDEFARLRADLDALAERVEALSAENAALQRQVRETAAVADEATGAVIAADVLTDTSWTERIRMDGDFRYRYENTDIEGQDDRNRSRIRARANVRADLTDNVEVGFGLATGGDDPVSANETLGGGGSSKRIALNLAYAQWNAVEGLNLVVGKFRNPLLRVGRQGLLWDGDWTPEGFAVTYRNGGLFANALGSWLESDSMSGNSSFSWGGQIGATGELGNIGLTGGLGYFELKTRGRTTFFGDPTDPADYYGNTAVDASGLACGTTVSATCFFLYDYLMTEVFAQAEFDLFGMPAVLFADYVDNSDPDSNHRAWTAGARIGDTRDRGDLQFSYYYADKESDGVFGLLTDSDFAGGGSDNKGHFFSMMLGINRSWSIGAQYFINEFDVATPDRNDINRLMLETQWVYR